MKNVAAIFAVLFQNMLAKGHIKETLNIFKVKFITLSCMHAFIQT